jgi:hypothetical protein
MCKHCDGTLREIVLEEDDAGILHEVERDCRCTRLISPSWPWLVLALLALICGVLPSIYVGVVK